MKIFFPYKEARGEQARLVSDVCEAIAGKRVLVASAPTGLGKTVSGLAPAVSFALEHKKKVFFLTPKSSQHKIALETANLMNSEFDLGIKSLDLVGKRKMCVHPLISHVSRGFYEACSGVVKDKQCVFYGNCKKKSSLKKSLGSRAYGLGHEEFRAACLKEMLCPYEVALEMVKDADLVIGDYFHVFDDDMRSNLLSSSGHGLSDCILVVDEAHNLPERIRDMLSATLRVEDLEKAASEAKSIGALPAMQALGELAGEFTSVVSRIPFGGSEFFLGESSVSSLKSLSMRDLPLVEDAARLFMRAKEIEGSFLLSSAVFMNLLCMERKNTLHLAERRMNSLRVSIYPLDPSEVSSRVFGSAYSSILMSGTLFPPKMYADVLGVKDPLLREYASPFPKENRLNLFVGKTTTKYSERSDSAYSEIGCEVSKVISHVPGNTIVFFPSFEILRAVTPFVRCGKPVLEQKASMTQVEKNKLVKDFKALGGRLFGGVLLAVSGGSFAEGIDFPGDELKCAVIAGIPFEKVSLRSKALIDFYDEKFGRGWDYAYVGPAINKAIQAAGRVIRSEGDKGVCIFLDKRFGEVRYKKFFPSGFGAVETIEPEREVEGFFSSY